MLGIWRIILLCETICGGWVSGGGGGGDGGGGGGGGG